MGPSGVFVGILTRGLVSTVWAVGLKRLRIPEPCTIETVPGLPFDHARNAMASRFMAGNHEWLFFLDDDVIPPPDAIEKLISRRHEIASGLYWKRQGRIVPTAYREAHPLPQPITGWQKGALLEADFVGGGCLLCHRSVFERVSKPWFEWRVDREDLPPGDRLGEDFSFSRKAREAGLRIHVDTSVECLHVGYGRSDGEGNFLPLSGYV